MGEGNEGGTALAIGGGSAGLGLSGLGTVRVLVLQLGSEPGTVTTGNQEVNLEPLMPLLSVTVIWRHRKAQMLVCLCRQFIGIIEHLIRNEPVQRAAGFNSMFTAPPGTISAHQFALGRQSIGTNLHKSVALLDRELA